MSRLRSFWVPALVAVALHLVLGFLPLGWQTSPKQQKSVASPGGLHVRMGLAARPKPVAAVAASKKAASQKAVPQKALQKRVQRPRPKKAQAKPALHKAVAQKQAVAQKPATAPAQKPLDETNDAAAATPPSKMAHAAKPPAEPAQPKASPDMRGHLRSYGQRLHGAVAGHRRYPRVARRLGLEGKVWVRVAVGQAGSLMRPPTIQRSSGHALLDDAALRIVRQAAPFWPLPGAFEQSGAVFVIPVAFDLAS